MKNKHADVAEHYFTNRPTSKPRLGLIQTCLRGKMFEFLTASGVFSKTKIDLGTRVLVESMILPEQGTVLDLGCGYGAVGIAAAAFNPKLDVIMVDVNSRAVWLARQNLDRNRIMNAEVRHGSVYDPVNSERFDCVLCNPPVTAGLEIVRSMICQAPQHMTDGGIFQMVVRSKVAGKRFCGFFEEAFGHYEVLSRESGYRVLASHAH